jgi:hypothetical protein
MWRRINALSTPCHGLAGKRFDSRRCRAFRRCSFTKRRG